jgi:predicted ATPase
LEVQRYRSLYDVEVDFTPLTALVGPNGAGKSNVIDALSFLGLALNRGIEEAINAKGGPDRFRFRGKRQDSHAIAVRVSVRVSVQILQTPRPGLQDYLQRAAEQGVSAPILHVEYGFGVSPLGRNGLSDFTVAHESIEIGVEGNSRRRPLLAIKRSGQEVIPKPSKDGALDPDLWNELVFPYSDESFAGQIVETLPDNQLLVGRLSFFNPVVAWLTSALGRLQPFSIIPIIGRSPGVPTSVGQIDTFGANLPSEVTAMQTHFPDRWARVMERMREIEPRFSRIEASLTGERRLTLDFVEDDRVPTWRASEVSDGTIRMLAMLAALYDPRFPIVPVEEPENSLNAWSVRSLVNACQEVVERYEKQVVLTSHSPALINFLAPEDIRVVWRDERGRTNVKPLLVLDPDVQAMWQSGDIFLFEVLDSGLVREAVPGTFS